MSGMKAHNSVACLVLGLVSLAAPPPSSAAVKIKLSGAISGVVTNAVGVPQMGASVLLFNRQDRLYEKGITDANGEFRFAGLVPDLYSVRVTLASFVPAVKDNILVQPGMRSMLNVSLATLFSSIQLVYPSAEQHTLMSDDWKWVLRTANSTRPVLRLLPGSDAGQPAEHASLFSETRGVLKISAGDGGLGPTAGGSTDLGTAFALATSLFGKNSLQFSGNLGSGSASGIPSAAFRTSFSREMGPGAPEISVTVRQLFLPGRIGEGITGSPDVGLPAMRSLSLSLDDHISLSDNLTMEYGFSMDSVSFLDRLNYFSPYAKLTYTMGPNAQVDFTYTSGNPRPDLASAVGVPDAEVRPDSDLQHDLSALSLFPRMSMLNGKPQVERGEDWEIGYTRRVGSRVFSLSGYRESVRNAALTIAAPDAMFSTLDMLPDLYSGASVFNAGNYQTLGYQLSATQALGEHLSATLMYGSMGALTVDGRELASDSPDELRSMIRAGRRHAATARVAATLPAAGTHLIASYQWTDQRWASPGHFYSTQSMRPDPGFNLYIRQPIPGFSMLPWRMEATLDFRNLLAQGYLPLTVAGGRRLLLMQTPRVFRGGLSFIF